MQNSKTVKILMVVKGSKRRMDEQAEPRGKLRTVTANDDYIQCHGLYVKIRKKKLEKWA